MAKNQQKRNKKQTESPKSKREGNNRSSIEMPFGKDNFILMAIGFGIIVLGYILMSGDTDIYSFEKITLAPIIVMFGYAFEAYAILKPTKQQKDQSDDKQ